MRPPGNANARTHVLPSPGSSQSFLSGNPGPHCGQASRAAEDRQAISLGYAAGVLAAPDGGARRHLRAFVRVP